jgi:hypothetical protein
MLVGDSDDERFRAFEWGTWKFMTDSRPDGAIASSPLE